MTFAIVGGGQLDTGYTIDNSLRFNDDDTAYLGFTPASTTDRKTFTISTWVKTTTLGETEQDILGAGPSGDQSHIQLHANRFGIRIYDGSHAVAVYTSALLRDVSAWYHLVVSVDTTQVTDSNRVKLYVNGIEQSSVVDFNGSTVIYPSLDEQFNFNNSSYTMYIGRRGHSLNYIFDGYLAEYHFIDGQQLDASSFGEFDEDSGIWKPKAYEGTYGTNGFYLDFEDSGSLGADQSGNGNNFTPTNLASTDQAADTPTNNFATINALQRNSLSTNTLSEGNLKQTSTVYLSANFATRPLTIQPQTGKWYFEAKYLLVAGAGNSSDFGVIPESKKLDDLNPGTGGGEGYGFRINAGNANVQKYTNNTPSNITGTSSPSDGDIYSLAIDFDNGKLYGWQNGTEFTGQDIGAGTSLVTFGTSDKFNIYIMTGTNSTNDAGWIVNTGNPPFSISSGNSDDNGYGNFEYAPPSGYLALCTQNLATELSPTIDDGSQYFNTVLYSGTGSSQGITGVGFQPDFTWIKIRNTVDSHGLVDSTRGATKHLRSSSDASEITRATDVSSFDSDGFTVVSDAQFNGSGDTYASWNWKANAGSTSSNTDGSITSTVQANTTAGFSIVTYTGTGANATIGHGLGKVPAMIITKTRDNVDNWGVYHQGVDSTAPEDYYLPLNLTNTRIDVSSTWNDTAPTSSVFSVGSNGVSNDTGGMVAYCFAEIEGYSKFGSYTGNGSTDGTFVYTGFRPSWLMVKRTADAARAWVIHDNKQDPDNPTANRLDANTAEGNQSSGHFDFLSNGFKCRSTEGATNAASPYIYMAFAENPFVSSTAIPVTAR